MKGWEDRGPFPDSVLVKRFELNGIARTERKILAVTVLRVKGTRKFRVRSRDGKIDQWLHLQDRGVTWE